MWLEGVVGREVELPRVLAVLDASGAGSPGVVLEGEPGIGKSTLWRAGLDEAERRGFCILGARAAWAEQDLAFAALGDLLADVIDEIGSLPEPQRRALRIALLLEESRGRPPEPRTIAVALTALVRRISLERRVLVAIDDAQWLDVPSAAALGFAFRRVDTTSVRFLATTRTNVDGAFPIADAERVILGPLARDALSALLWRRLGARFLRPVLRQVEEVSGGNPFYAIELAAAWLQSGRELELGERLPLPARLRDVVDSRLGTLSRPAREAVLATAVLARPTMSTVAGAIGGRGAVEEAVSAGVLAGVGESLWFTHPLFATGVLDASSESEQRRIHGRLADLVTEAEERARHLAEAAEGPNEAIAAAVEAAAARTAGRGAPDSAVGLAKRAVELTPADERTSLHKRRLDCARYAFAAGDPRHAAEMLVQQRVAAAAGRERAEVGLELARAVRASHGASAAITHCEAALREVDGGRELELEALILTELAGMHLAEMRTDSDASERAVALAERVSNAGLLARALAEHGLTLNDRGLPPTEEYWERALEIERTSGQLLARGPAHAYAIVLFARGEFEAAEASLREVAGSMRRDADPALPNVLLFFSDVARAMGAWDDAFVYAEEAYQVVRETARDSLEPQCLLYEARFAMLRGELRDARSRVASALEALGQLRKSGAISDGPVVEEGLADSLLARIALMSGRFREAHEQCALVIETLRSIELRELLVEALADDVAALVALGAFEDAAREAAEAEEIAHALGKPSLEALAARSCGLVSAAEGDVAAALEQLDRSRELLDQAASPWPFELAKTLVALGSVQRRARQRQPARENLEHALAIFESLGAALWAGQARSELQRIGGRPSRGNKLTETERRVAELVGSGRSNAEAARELFMSPKTVEWNLSKIYKKLHVRSRAELAVKLTKQPVRPQS
jgi:DNA-binding CsgD family transcriptional regulator